MIFPHTKKGEEKNVDNIVLRKYVVIIQKSKNKNIVIQQFGTHSFHVFL